MMYDKIVCIVLLISIPQTVCRIIATEDDIVTVHHVVEYLRGGVAIVRNLMPELKHEYVHDEIFRADSLARLKYTQYSFEYFKRGECDCKNVYGLDCGTFYEEELYRDEDLPLEAAKFLFERNYAYMVCCSENFQRAFPNRPAGLPYFQTINLHRRNKFIYDMAVQHKLGRAAALLLQHPTVRLYQTTLFVKNASAINKGTSWHHDLNMVPLDVNAGGYVTFWCPLTSLRVEDGDSVLKFAHGSHRDRAYGHWYSDEKPMPMDVINKRYSIVEVSEFEVGDCTAHDGWILHAANEQMNRKQARVAIGFSFVAGNARRLEDLHATGSRPWRSVKIEDELSYADWIYDIKGGEIIDHPLLPVVYSEV
mmetsp:Transcript_16669/g.25071  ORF Transcript_16669/g.25071 Transcript_16669/m.25071 type:complete len:365 (+) Transcript_16669:3-1097(+)